jgi:hypothetical protein
MSGASVDPVQDGFVASLAPFTEPQIELLKTFADLRSALPSAERGTVTKSVPYT